jgi:hypothetical protein
MYIRNYKLRTCEASRVFWSAIGCHFRSKKKTLLPITVFASTPEIIKRIRIHIMGFHHGNKAKQRYTQYCLSFSIHKSTYIYVRMHITTGCKRRDSQVSQHNTRTSLNPFLSSLYSLYSYPSVYSSSTARHSFCSVLSISLNARAIVGIAYSSISYFVSFFYSCCFRRAFWLPSFLPPFSLYRIN